MSSIQHPEKPSQPAVSTPEQNLLQAVRDMVRTCIQCGTCSASCPNEFAMDCTPRHLWRMVLMDDLDEVLATHTFALCSSCYLCTLRCPRGLPLTDAMAALKQAAAILKVKEYRPSGQFYEQFLNSVKRHGRVQEMELMALYFAERKDPRLPLRFTSMGLKLIAKGKIGLPKFRKGPRALDALFDKVAALEKGAAQ